MALFVEDKVKR